MSAHPSALRLVTSTLASLIRPPEPLPFEVWIEREIELIDGPYAGSPFSFAGAPALREIAQCLNEIEAQYGYEFGRVVRRNIEELRAGKSVTKIDRFTSAHGGYRER